jgi:hypothetical protein
MLSQSFRIWSSFQDPFIRISILNTAGFIIICSDDMNKHKKKPSIEIMKLIRFPWPFKRTFQLNVLLIFLIKLWVSNYDKN